MDRRRFTIILLSPKLGKMCELGVARALLVLWAFCVCSSVLFGAYGLRQHFTLIEQSKQLRTCFREYQINGEKLLEAASEIDALKQQMIRIHRLDTKLRVIADLEDAAPQVQLSGMGGVNPEGGILACLPRERREEWAGRIRDCLRELTSTADEQEASLLFLEKALNEKKDLLANTPSVWPTLGWLSSGFGYRASPFTGLREFHRGVDIAYRAGTPVIAPADGVVVQTGTDPGFGRYVRLKHGYGYQTFYGHLGEIIAKKGQGVRRGQMIAKIGNTGRSTGPHLHYEVHVSGLPVNPLRYMIN
jgi:murein DD-endopeptidase MepM/ murein hydrolase activator NlpD